LLSKIFNSKLISVVWGYDVQIVPGVKHYGVQGLRRIMSRFVIEKSDLVIVNHIIHKKLAERLKGSPSNKIIFVAPAIPDISISIQDELTSELRDKLRVKDEALKKIPIVMYSPSLEPLYGIIEFIKAASIVSFSVRNCIFIVVGEGKLKDEAIRLVKESRLENKVIFTSKISHESMKVLYKLSTLVCDLAYPGTGTTALEAFCFGKPVIGIKSPKTIITHGTNGFLIERDDPQALAKYIVKILQNSSLRKRLSENARKTYEEKFSMEKRIESLLMVFQMLGLRRKLL
jgi:glycosyltransferase involved in cell wall biosynthesis